MGKFAYETHELDNSCVRIEENGVRAFLITGSERAILVDTGFGTGNLKEVTDSLTSLPVTLVNTHADGDHLGCNRQFGPAHMHPAEYDRYHQTAGADAPTAPLWEGDILDLGGRSFEVILIPGHTPGSIALLDEKNRVLISGDSVQAGTIFMFGAGRNLAAYIESMKKLRRLAGKFDTVWPSHGPIPVEAGILDGLISGAERLQRGELEGEPAPFKDIAAKAYDAGVAKFLSV